MQILRALPSLVLAISFASPGCGDEGSASAPDASTAADGGGLGVNDLVGSWQASSHSFTNNANETETWDLIADGVTTRATVLVGGGVRLWVEDSLSEPWVEAGTHLSGVFDSQWGIIGNTLRIITTETPSRTWDFGFTLEDNILTLTNANSDFDFTRQGGTPVAATSKIVLVRQ